MINWQIARVLTELSFAILFMGFILGCLFCDYFITRPALQALNRVIREDNDEIKHLNREIVLLKASVR